MDALSTGVTDIIIVVVILVIAGLFYWLWDHIDHRDMFHSRVGRHSPDDILDAITKKDDHYDGRPDR